MADALSLLQQLLAGQPAYRPEDQGDYLRRYLAGTEPGARGAPPANLTLPEGHRDGLTSRIRR
jgi:hypothetical protein